MCVDVTEWQVGGLMQGHGGLIDLFILCSFIIKSNLRDRYIFFSF